MKIRKAQLSDIPKILDLLSQVLETHAKIRPDIYISGTTKFTEQQLDAMIESEENNIYVAENESGDVVGHLFFRIKNQPVSNNMRQFSSLFIEDLCVDENARRKHVGKALFEFAKAEAKRRGCYEITLVAWNGNDPANAFYQNMGMTPKEIMYEQILN